MTGRTKAQTVELDLSELLALTRTVAGQTQAITNVTAATATNTAAIVTLTSQVNALLLAQATSQAASSGERKGLTMGWQILVAVVGFAYLLGNTALLVVHMIHGG